MSIRFQIGVKKITRNRTLSFRAMITITIMRQLSEHNIK